jgi:hypothetical protein
MFAIAAAVFVLAQTVVLERADSSDKAVMNAEILERPRGMTTTAFLERLIDEAGAREWERTENRAPFEGVELRVVGLKSGPRDGIMLFMPAAENSPNNFCRIRRQNPGDPTPQRDTLIGYCFRVAAGLHPASAPARQPLRN